MAQIVVGMADMRIGTGSDELVTYALGSCVGICMYDEAYQLGGMLHAMLPSADSEGIMVQTNRYVDSGVPYLFKALCRRGAEPKRIRAKLAGGASMFEFVRAGSMADIGEANVIQAKKILYRLGVPIVGEMVGGSVGRTVFFSAGTGGMRIKTTSNEEYLI